MCALYMAILLYRIQQFPIIFDSFFQRNKHIHSLSNIRLYARDSRIVGILPRAQA